MKHLVFLLFVWILIILIALFALGLFDSGDSVSAAAPPGSDNVSIWFSDNITGNVTLSWPNLELSLTEAGEAHAEAVSEGQSVIWTEFLKLGGFLVLLGVAYWHRERWLYVIAGFGTLAYAFDYSSTSVQIGSLLAFLGVYNFFKAVYAKNGRDRVKGQDET